MAASLYKYAKIAGYDVSGTDSEFKGFSDSGEASSWAVDAMAWAVGSGIFEAEPNGGLNPRGQASRGWKAQMFMKFIYLRK